MSAASKQEITQHTTVTTVDEPFTLVVREGIIWLRWSSGVVVDSSCAARVVEQVSRLRSRWTLPILVHLNGMKSLSRCAMQILARDLEVSASASVGPSAVDRTISAFFVQVHAPTYPAQHFSTTESALSWLRSGRGSDLPEPRTYPHHR